jgi:hypothetical protein
MKHKTLYTAILIIILSLLTIFQCSIRYDLTQYLLSENEESKQTSSAAVITSFYENFEDGDISDWIKGISYTSYTFSFPNTSSITPIAGIIPTTAKCMNFNCSGSTPQQMEGIYKYIGEFRPSYISLYMRFNSSLGMYNCFMLSKNHSYAERTIYINYSSGPPSNIVFNDMFSYPCSLNTWYFIELKNIDWTNHKYDVYINNLPAANGITIHSINYSDSFNCIDIYHQSYPASGFIDDIMMNM